MIEVWEASHNVGYLKYPLAKLIDLDPDDDYGITDTGKCLLMRRFRIRFYDNLDKKSKARIFSDDIDNTKAVILQFPKNTNPYEFGVSGFISNVVTSKFSLSG